MTEAVHKTRGATRWSVYALGAVGGLVLVTGWTWGYRLLWHVLATPNRWLGLS